jgi:uncharacterized repeat protein (TIGR03803 family)
MVNLTQHRNWISITRPQAASAALSLGVALLLTAFAAQAAQAQTYTVLYAFKGQPDGAIPYAGLLMDAPGNLYGTTYAGGLEKNHGKLNCINCGTVFKLDSSGKETVLHRFAGGSTDGAYPVAGLVRDAAGNLYGTTTLGGRRGTVFKLAKTGKNTVLYRFGSQQRDGTSPHGGLVRDPATGNFYGTTYDGGASCRCGTVFKLATTGKETVLHSFNRTDGDFPLAGLVRDAAGNLYGTTSQGGGLGNVFELDTTGKLTVLYNFTGGADGARPYAGLMRTHRGTCMAPLPLGAVPDATSTKAAERCSNLTGQARRPCYTASPGEGTGHFPWQVWFRT